MNEKKQNPDNRMRIYQQWNKWHSVNISQHENDNFEFSCSYILSAFCAKLWLISIKISERTKFVGLSGSFLEALEFCEKS